MPEPLLSLAEVHAGYGSTEILRGVNFALHSGEIVTILGPNGAGKSTMSRTISGIVRTWRGSIRFKGVSIEREAPAKIVERGLIHVPEGRRIFPNMTVRENLDLGSYRRARRSRAENRERVFSIFPRLSERQSQRAGTLSGGEQQMLAIGRGLMSRPKLVLFDEPSLGLAPAVVQDVLRTIRDLNREGLTCLLVEQNVALSLKLAQRAYVLENGRVVLAGSGDELLADDRVRRAYLGV